MEADSELLLRLYAQARGCGGEFYGERYLAADRWVRTNGIPETARKWATGQSAEFRPLIESFVRGVNAWAAEHETALSADAQRVLPVSVEDVYAHCLRVIHTTGSSIRRSWQGGCRAPTSRHTAPTNGRSRRHGRRPATPC
jgi:acyl-homoserine-lactone acylase